MHPRTLFVPSVLSTLLIIKMCTHTNTCSEKYIEKAVILKYIMIQFDLIPITRVARFFFRNPPNFSQMSQKSSQIFFLNFHKVKF